MKLLLILAIIIAISIACPTWSNSQICIADETSTIYALCDTYNTPLADEAGSITWERCSKAVGGLKLDGDDIILDTTFSFWNAGIDEVSATPSHADYTEYLKLNSYYYQLNLVSQESWLWDQMSCVVDKQFIVKCKPAFFYKADEYKCASCGTNCASCSDALICTQCNGGYFLSAAGTCGASPCTTGALTCADDTKAATCIPGKVLKADDGTCEDCPLNSYCEVKTTIKTCKSGYFKNTTATPNTCDLCTTNQANVLTCSGSVAASPSSDNILQCKYSDSTNNYHKVEGRGCISQLKADGCLTISWVTSAYKCDSCVSGLYLHNGACKPCDASNFGTGVKTCTSGATNADPAVVTCEDGYYREIRAASAQDATRNQCAACTANCAKCTMTDTAATLPTCTEASQGYAIDLNTLTLVECSDEAGCKACTLTGASGSQTYSDCSANQLNTGYYKGTVGVQANQVFACGASTASYHTSTTPATAVADCSECTFDTTKGLKAVQCTACPNTHSLMLKYTTTAADTYTDADFSAFTCVIIATAPTGSGKYKENTTSVTQLILKCRDPFFYTAGPPVSCAASTVTNCKRTKSDPADARENASTAAAGVCAECNTGYVRKSDGTVCQQKPANCLTIGAFNTANAATRSLCTACDADSTTIVYVRRSDNTACYTCTLGADPVQNCAEFEAGTSACQCKTCLPGYYKDASTPPKCINTKAANCLFMDQTVTTKTCYACKIGYKADAEGNCVACSAESPCATSGCDGLAYPGMPEVTTTPAAANSAIVCFFMALFVLLMTILI